MTSTIDARGCTALTAIDAPAAKTLDARERPFDKLRVSGKLAPGDWETNTRRWLTGEALRRLHERLSSEYPEVSLFAADKLHAATLAAGALGWTVLVCIVIEGKSVSECRSDVRCTAAAIHYRLRNALDAIAPVVGITS